MAEKRMFTQKIIDSDQFLDMPLSTQALYFHLNMRADDDGFINNPKRIMRTIGASEDDLKILLMKRFVIGFENDVLVIKHWRMHNTLRKDRYNPTQYQDELKTLRIKENKSYTEAAETVLEIPATNWQPSGNHLEPQYSIGEYSIDKYSIDKYSIGEIEETEPTPAPSKKESKHKHGEYNNVLLTDSEIDKLQKEYPDYLQRIERLSSYIASTGKSYKSHYATIRNWAKRDAEEQGRKQPAGGRGRKEPVPAWMNKPSFTDMESREIDFDSIEQASMEQLHGVKTAGNDPGIRERAEALREQFRS